MELSRANFFPFIIVSPLIVLSKCLGAFVDRSLSLSLFICLRVVIIKMIKIEDRFFLRLPNQGYIVTPKMYLKV